MSRGKERFKADLLVILFLFLSSILLSYPLIQNLSSGITGSEGFRRIVTDSPKYLFYIHSFKESILHFENPLHIEEIFYPGGIGIQQDPTAPLFSLCGALLTIIFNLNVITAHNLLTLIFLTLSGLSMYYFIYHFTEDNISSLLGAFLFISSPMILSRFFLGEGNLMPFLWIPLIFLLMERLFDRPNLKNSLMLAILFILQLLTSAQFTLFVVIMTPLYLLVRVNKWRTNKKSFLRYLSLAGVLSVFLSSFYWINYFPLKESLTRSLSVVSSMSLSGIGSVSMVIQIIGAFSFPLSILSILFLVYRRNNLVIPFLLLGLAGFLLALGPFHEFAPYTILFRFFPFLDKFEAPYRFILFTVFSFSFLNALFISKQERSTKLVTFAVAFSVILLISPNPAIVNLGHNNKIFRFLEDKKGNFSIMEYPEGRSGWDNYRVTVHGKNLVCGTSTYPVESCYKFTEVCGGDYFNISDSECREMVERYDLRYLVFHSYDYREWKPIYREYLSSEHMKFIEKSQGLYLFELV